ncbi:reverse transcriptase domain-containing protein [Tanacetum coccineum]
MPSDKAKEERPGTGRQQSHPRRSEEISRGTNHKRGALPQLALKPGHEIDWKIESLCRYPFKCFLEAYKGYHQIHMAEEDEEKTAFHTSQRVYWYTKMSFGLKNAGATYQRLVDKALKKQIGRNLEVYVDDLKCTFGAEEGTFLGHIVNMQGIKACPKKAEAVIKLQSPRTLKEVETEAERAFQEMKQCIAELPMLTAPKPKEELIMYLCAAKEAVSAVLLTESDSQQMPIYFVSRALQAPKINYSSMEKLEDGPPTGIPVEEEISKPWALFTDGSSCLEGSGAGLILTNPEGIVFTYALRFEFDACNIEAEYKALVAGLCIAKHMGVKNLEAKVDSRLVANQINGSYVAKEQSMIQCLEKAKALSSSFKFFSIKQVPRSENKKADALCKIASTSFAHLTKQVLVEVLKEKSIEEKEILAVVEEGYSWMTPLLEYLTDDTLLAETKKARAIKIKSRQYAVIGGVLYHKSFLEPWL